jgi:hypothetical protein
MMHNSIRIARRPRRAWLRTARIAAASIATVGLALLAVACASPPSASTGGSSNAAVAAKIRSANNRPPDMQKMLAYSRCMRSHGVPNFPDPDGSGRLPKESVQQLKVSDSRLQTAQKTCLHLWPYQSPTRAKPRRTGSGTQNQPTRAKPRKPGSGAQIQPPRAKPTPGAGQ